MEISYNRYVRGNRYRVHFKGQSERNKSIGNNLHFQEGIVTSRRVMILSSEVGIEVVVIVILTVCGERSTLSSLCV